MEVEMLRNFSCRLELNTVKVSVEILQYNENENTFLLISYYSHKRYEKKDIF